MCTFRWRGARLAFLLVLCFAWTFGETVVFDPAVSLADTNLTVGGEARVSYTDGDNIRLRDEPSYGGGVLTSVPEGWLVAVLDGPFSDGAGNSWYKVIARGQTGYMVSDYLANPGGSSDVNAGSISGSAVTTSSLNLRNSASINGSVLLVIPSGAAVQTTDDLVNGYRGVMYQGTSGWAADQYLGDSSGSAAPAEVIDTAFVIDGALNLRSGPSTGYGVLLVMPDAAEVGVLGDVESGFYPVRYAGTDGWAYAEYLSFGGSPTAPEPHSDWQTRYATASLNLRSGPGLGFSVLTVIPGGGHVETSGASEDGYYPVVYNGTSGYASATYLTDSAPASSGPGTGGNGIVWPVSGGAWEITQGYNGSSHVNRSSTWQYYYSLDLARQDRATAGQSVYAPVSGTVRWTERSSGGITIDLGNGYAVALFHVTVDRGWGAGDHVDQGDYIGTVSYPGGEGFAEFSHVHLAVWSTDDGGNWDRHAVPFTGSNAISGTNFPDVGGGQQWTGTDFYP